MREIQITVSPNDIAYADPGTILGRAGEQSATRVLFDVSAWGEVGPYSVAGQNADGVAWILEPILTAADGIVTVDMPDAMVAKAGMARLEIRAETVGRRRKAAAIMLPVADGLTAGAAPADAAPAWIDGLSQAAAALGGQIETGTELYTDMEAARDRAEEYAGLAAQDRAGAQEAAQATGEDRQATEAAEERARGHADRAEEAADDAHGWAVVAENGIKVASFEIDENGDLIQHMPDGESNLEFALNDAGELEVTIHGYD